MTEKVHIRPDMIGPLWYTLHSTDHINKLTLFFIYSISIIVLGLFFLFWIWKNARETVVYKKKKCMWNRTLLFGRGLVQYMFPQAEEWNNTCHSFMKATHSVTSRCHPWNRPAIPGPFLYLASSRRLHI
jgi:hypothetical protein